MIHWFDRLVGRWPTGSSGAIAKERLKVVLEYDRAQLAPGVLDEIRGEIIEAISRHARVDPARVQISLRSGGRLVLEVPLESATRQGLGSPAA